MSLTLTYGVKKLDAFYYVNSTPHNITVGFLMVKTALTKCDHKMAALH